MKEGWTYKKLGEVCETLNGLWKGKKPPFVNVGVIRNANFTKDFTLRYDNVEYLDVEEKQYVKRKLQRGDLIIEKSGGSEKQPVGRAVLFDKENGEFSFSNFTSVLRVKNDILQSRFLYIYLLFIYKRGDTLKMQKATTGIHNIEFDKYLNIDIPILPFAQQQRIVSSLDAAFAHIDALKANAEKQLAEARQLFQAELAECMRPKEGWEEKRLGEVCEIFGRIGFRGYTRGDLVDTPEKGAITLSPSNIVDGEMNYNKCTYITWKKYEESPEIMIYPGDILLVKTASVGKTALVKSLPHKATINPQFVVMKKITIDNRYLSYYLKTEEAQHYIWSIAKGAAAQTVSQKNLAEMKIPVPDDTVQQFIVSRLDALSANIKKLEEVQRKTLAECDALKQAMFREVFE